MQWAVILTLFLSSPVLCSNLLSTNGYSFCVDNPSIDVTQMSIRFNRATNEISFDVAGWSSLKQNVSAKLTVTAYGKEVYANSIDPCKQDQLKDTLCPLPSGNFSARGIEKIPSTYTSMIPSIAYTIPDIDGGAKLELLDQDGNGVACIQSSVTNGKTMAYPAVSYITAGIAGCALLLSGSAAMLHGGIPGATVPSPSFLEVVGFFQGIAVNGMLSVSYPPVYQKFTQNFAFSTGLVSWSRMQTVIDDFRAKTGGDLSQDSYAYLQNVTLVRTANGSSTGATLFRRALLSRQVSASIDGTSIGAQPDTTDSNPDSNTEMHYVSGIQAYVEELSIPQSNTFMTVLLVFAVVIAAITVVILLTKVILELVALTSTLPRSLESFRKHYWRRLAKVITNLVLLLYGTWTLYCVYQFTNGDSWAAKTLAAVSWAMFTTLLCFFIYKIYTVARACKKLDGDAGRLFEDKETWIKYSLFYDCFKRGCWWLFVPAIVYMFARNTVIAAANGHGMTQAIGQMAIEIAFLVLLLWYRPYTLRSGNWINIVIQVVRVLSVCCILVFVEQLGFAQTTQTITGVALIVVQSVLTGVLAILIAVNAIIACVRENPHRKRRKQAERDEQGRAARDTLTPLDARNSLLMAGSSPVMEKDGYDDFKTPLVSPSIYSTMSREGPVPGSADRHESDKKGPVVTVSERSPEKPKVPTIWLPDLNFGK